MPERPRGRLRRRYPDGGFEAFALNMLGGRWSIAIIDRLTSGPCRFGQLRRSANGVSGAMLDARLRQLEEAGIIERAAAPGGHVYGLTPLGRECAPILKALKTWVRQRPAQPT